MKKITVFIVSLTTLFLECNAFTRSVSHGLAVCDGRKGAWDKALVRMVDLLAQDYDDPRILYDAGVAAYKTGQFEQARAYFQDCCASDKSCNELKECAYFNKGNVDVEQKKLEDALSAYQQTLEINPDNQAARHNRDKVKEMLEQQKQQEQKDKNQSDQSQDQQSQDNKQGDQKDQSGQQGEQDNEKKSNNEDQKSSEGANNKSNSHKQDESNDNQSSSDKDPHGDTQQNNQSQKNDDKQSSSSEKNNGDNNKKDDNLSQRGDTRDSASNKETKQQPSEQKGDNASGKKGRSEEKDTVQEQKAKADALDAHQAKEPLEKNERAVAAAQETNEDLFGNNKEWMAQLLQAQENADKETNKKMVKTTIATAVVDNDGNNSW